MFHWDGFDRDVWNFDQEGLDWYIYQAAEMNIMNSTTMPDRVRPVEEFRDYIFASKAIGTLKKLITKPKPFLLSVGFKLPHLALHVPYKYYEMYNTKQMMENWKLSERERTFPPSTTSLGYRCCAEMHMIYMKNESQERYMEIKFFLSLSISLSFFLSLGP